MAEMSAVRKVDDAGMSTRSAAKEKHSATLPENSPVKEVRSTNHSACQCTPGALRENIDSGGAIRKF